MSGNLDFINALTVELRKSKNLDADVVAVLIDRLLENGAPKKAVDDVVIAVQNIAYKRAAK